MQDSLLLQRHGGVLSWSRMCSRKCCRLVFWMEKQRENCVHLIDLRHSFLVIVDLIDGSLDDRMRNWWTLWFLFIRKNWFESHIPFCWRLDHHTIAFFEYNQLAKVCQGSHRVCVCRTLGFRCWSLGFPDCLVSWCCCFCLRVINVKLASGKIDQKMDYGLQEQMCDAHIFWLA